LYNFGHSPYPYWAKGQALATRFLLSPKKAKQKSLNTPLDP